MPPWCVWNAGGCFCVLLLVCEGVFISIRVFYYETVYAASRSGEHARHFVVIGWGQEKESRRGREATGLGIDAVERQCVKVKVEIQRGAEALEERDGAALRGSGPPVMSRTAAQLGEEGPHESAKHRTRECRVVGTAVTERVGKREYPLADRNFGQDPIDEVRGGVRPAAAAAGGAEAAALVGEWDETIVAAVVAVKAQEAVGQNAAAQEGAEPCSTKRGTERMCWGDRARKVSSCSRIVR